AAPPSPSPRAKAPRPERLAPARRRDKQPTVAAAGGLGPRADRPQRGRLQDETSRGLRPRLRNTKHDEPRPDEQAMNDTEPLKKSEFFLRRLEESFPQFMGDLWDSTPLWLLIPAILAVVARVAWGSYYRSTHPHAKKDATTYWLGWTAILAVGALVTYVLV